MEKNANVARLQCDGGLVYAPHSRTDLSASPSDCGHQTGLGVRQTRQRGNKAIIAAPGRNARQEGMAKNVVEEAVDVRPSLTRSGSEWHSMVEAGEVGVLLTTGPDVLKFRSPIRFSPNGLSGRDAGSLSLSGSQSVTGNTQRSL